MRVQSGFLLTILAAAAILPAVPASAQGSGGPVSVYSEPLPPAAGPGQRRYEDANSYPVQADPRDRHYYPSNSAPAPADEAAYGHQLESTSPLGVNEADIV